MPTLFKEVNYNLASLVDSIDMGVIGLPDIQRPFQWEDTKVRDLFDSMYKGFPVGYLLFWQSAQVDGTHVRSIGTEKKQKNPSLLIVDGQQRLTSLYAVIKGKEVIRKNYEKDTIRIAFNPLDETFEVAGAAINRNPKYVPNISVMWQAESDLFEIVESFTRRLSESMELGQTEIKKIRDAFSRLKNLHSYPFSAMELPSTMDEEQVADVFVRINSKGESLKQADFILTLMSVFWDEGRTELEAFCRLSRQPSKDASTPFNYIMEPQPDQMLRVSVGYAFRRARMKNVYNLLRGKDMQSGDFSDQLREAQFARLKEAQRSTLHIQQWHEFLKAIQQSGYTRAAYISSDNNLLYAYVLFLIGREDYGMDLYALRQLIARWYFMISVSGRYTNSPETEMEKDLANLRDAHTADDFAAVLNRAIANQFTHDYWMLNLPQELESSSARSPSLFAYYAALHIHDATGLFSKLKVSQLLQAGLKAKKSALEKHHLFPRNYLIKMGIHQKRNINQIANYALVEWSDNIAIRDKAPAEYLPAYLERLTPEERQQMYYWHALPEGWEYMEYNAFLTQRRSLIARVIQDAFEKL
jgi:hypothetical protein